MEKQPFLVFSLNSEIFAIDALVVREIKWLPELTSIEETPHYIAGVFNLRGNIIPVIDLNIRFGHPYQRYNLTDSVIIIESAECGIRNSGLKSEVRNTNHEIRFTRYDVRDALHEVRLFGLIVNEVHDVINISSEDIEPSPFCLNSALPTPPSALEKSRHHFIDSEAKVGENIIMILNHNKIFDAGFHSPEAEEHKLKESHYFCPEATAEERKIFHERAVNLMHAVEEENLVGLIPMAVVGLSGEFFGVELELVLEFTDMHDVVPIPCCPEHILGNMNLRGDILTLVDIRGVLNLPAGRLNLSGKVIVTRIGELFVGVPVDEVFDVRYVNPDEITEVPSAIQGESEEFIKGTAPYGAKMMTILNLSKMLTREDLVVNEEA